MSAPAVDGPLTIAERDSIRRMVGWQEDWADDPDDRPARTPDVVAREQRLREWFAAEGINPMVRLPYGARAKAIAAVGFPSVESFAWSLRNIRGRHERRRS